MCWVDCDIPGNLNVRQIPEIDSRRKCHAVTRHQNRTAPAHRSIVRRYITGGINRPRDAAQVVERQCTIDEQTGRCQNIIVPHL